MKIFLPVLAAILVAAAIIFGIRGCANSFDDLARMRAQTKLIQEQADAAKKRTDEINREREELRRSLTPGH